MCNNCKQWSIKLIETYQKHLSPDHSHWAKNIYPGWYCKYTPTCSEYTKESINKYWFFKWWLKGGYRVLRCNPFSKWWVDNP
jgi:hypothetical protein